MSRRIETGIAGAKLGPGSPQEEYLGRLAKYIPTEIVGLYIAAAGVIPAADSGRSTALWWVFAGCIVLTPVYLIYATGDPKKGPLWMQVLLATIAFPIWVFAMGGPFATLPWYRGWIASIVLFFVTVAFGLIKPKTGS